MKKSLFVAGVALFALTAGSAMAADLIVDEPTVEAAAASDAGWYMQLLGGATLSTNFDYNDANYDIPSSWALAGVVGAELGIDGLSAELDVFATQSGAYTSDYKLTTGTVMAALKYTVALNDTFSVYGAVGVGGVYMLDDSADYGKDIDGWGAGYLLKAGVTAAVAENISLVGEVRYADTFAPIESMGNEGQHGAAAVLVGLQIGL